MANFVRLEKAVCKLTCGEIKDCEKATAFLISPNKAITARHAIEDYYDENKQIFLEFCNITSKPIFRKAKPLDIPPNINSPIVILELDECVETDVYLSFCDYEIEKDDRYETFGYPVVKWQMGQWINSEVSRRVTQQMARPFDWDIDLNHSSNIKDFGGLSGAPLFIKKQLVGVLLTESKAGGKAISLGCISIERLKDVLQHFDIPIKEFSHDFIMDEIYELDDDSNFSESIFIAKLESAQIFDHEDYQQEFFNAEIAKTSIESRNISTEVKSFSMLQNNIKSIWRTQHLSYNDDFDGRELLTKVYTRVEDLNEGTLKSTPELPLLVKKGILHQLSDECKVGWTKNYKDRLKSYLEERERIDG
ncbi:hypothetical protein BGM26_04570 [Bacillus sp. FJAT-29790]|uniref:hypothetical protein n=1 Tax=Bacillus sp. FJAT-29790 TaxID=1895002 RepID=UPI001C219BB8|nr:hypothetical protein [Bacillus sp. FJAT-29790]MBU8878261.1 hypothetical protein [Bacillus sp. FJAT-29790]